jgi:hypothetical protein
MTTTLACSIAALAICVGGMACANDTGQPKAGTQGPFTPGAGFPGVSPPFPAGSPNVPPTSIGTAPTGFEPGLDPGVASCSDARGSANGLVSDACVQCACKMKPAETIACGAACWALLVCVTQHCSPTDTNCIVAECAALIGGAANLAAVGAQARAVPFSACASQCITDDFSEAGRENDF